MTNEIKEKIIILKRVDESILELYKYLASLEKNNLQITEEYYKSLVKLNSSIKLEKEILEGLFIDPENILNVYLYFYKLLVEEDSISIIISNSTEKIINYRLFEIIRGYILSNGEQINILGIKEQLKNAGFDDDVSYQDMLENKDIQRLINKDKKVGIFANAILQDFNMLFITLLNKKIENEENKRVMRELIDAKYVKFFVTPSIEQDLLNKAFNIPLEVCFNTFIIASIYKIDAEIAEEIINLNKKAILSTQLYKLMPKNQIYISKTDLELYLRELELRTIFSIYSNEELEETYKEFIDSVGELKESFFKDSFEVVTRAYNEHQNDRKLINGVTLKK